MKKVMGIIMSLMLMFFCMNVVLADDSETTSCVVKYAVGENDVITANQEIKLDGITMTYGNDTFITHTSSTPYVYGTKTPRDKDGGSKAPFVPASGCYYQFNPTINGKLSVAIVLSAGKAFYVIENETPLEEYNGVKKEEKYCGTFDFEVKANSTYYVYGSGSKLGLSGFEYQPDAKVPYTINYIYNGKTLYSDESEDFIFSTIKQKKHYCLIP